MLSSLAALALPLLMAPSTHAIDGLLGYWRFDEGNGEIAIDSSDNGNNGQIVEPGDAWVTDAERGSVYQSGGGSYVDLGEILPVLDENSDFTWSFWVKPNETDNNNIVFGNRWGPDGVDFAPREFIKFTPRKFEWHFDGGGQDVSGAETMFEVDVWTHNLVVKDGTTLTYYRDGEEILSGEITAGPVNPQPLYIGGQDGRENFSGLFDEVAIFGRALSLSEVMEVYQAGLINENLNQGGLALDFNDQAQFDELEVVSNDNATTEWRANDGVDDSGYISLTDAENGARAAIIFPSIDRPIAGFNFSVDARIGGGTDRPADGFSVNIVRPGDPLLEEGSRGEGYAASPTGEANLPEEGSQTGLGIGFDAWFSGGSDTVGFSVRVDNEILQEIPAETLNGEADDVTSLQTGPQSEDFDNPYSELTWQTFTANLNPNTNVLRITWKGEEVFNERIDYFPSPGTVVFGARTGGANQAHHFDNLNLETVVAVRPVVVRRSISRDGLSITYQNFPESMLVNDSIKLTVDGADVTADSTIESATGNDGESLVVINYAPPEQWAFESTHTWKVEATESNGNAVTNEVADDLVKAPIMGADPIPGPPGANGVAGVRYVWGNGTVANIPTAIEWLRSADEPAFEGQVADFEHEYINHGSGAGQFGDDDPYPDDVATDDLWTGEDFVQYANGKVRIPRAGDYTFWVQSDDGFALRVRGLTFTDKTGGANIDPISPDSFIFPGPTGNSNSRVVATDVRPGVYDLEFLWFERGGGDFGELAVAEGNHLSGGDQEFRLVGITTGARQEFPQPGVDADGWDVMSSAPGGDPIENLEAGRADIAATGEAGNFDAFNFMNNGAMGSISGDFAMPTDGGGDDNDFAVSGTATLVIPVTGSYEIGFQSDDGMEVRIVGQEWGEIIENATGSGEIDGDAIRCDCLTGNSRTVATINLEAGTYEIEAIYFERGGGAYGEVFGRIAGSPNYSIITRNGADSPLVIEPGGLAWVGEPIPAPDIYAYEHIDGNVAISFTTPNPDSDHILEQSLDLVQWGPADNANLAMLAGDAGFQFTATQPADPAAYFRIGILPPPPPFSEDFESGAEGWVATTLQGDTMWELGTPAVDGLAAARSGDNAYGTDLDGPYGNDAAASLRSPVIDLTEIARPKLSFWYYVDATEEAEGVQLKILDEGGNDLWVREEIFWGTSPGWEQFSQTIPSDARGQKIIIEWLLLTDGGEPNGSGFYIDDVVVDD